MWPGKAVSSVVEAWKDVDGMGSAGKQVEGRRREGEESLKWRRTPVERLRCLVAQVSSGKAEVLRC